MFFLKLTFMIKILRKLFQNYVPIVVTFIFCLILYNNYSKTLNNRLAYAPVSESNANKVSKTARMQHREVINKANPRVANRHDKKSSRTIKYVVYECVDHRCGGWADRLKGILNAYAWSLFTKREFLINFTQPCNLNNLIDANEVKWNRNVSELIDNGQLNANYSKFVLNKVDDLKYRSDLRFVDVVNFEKDTDIISIRTNLEWFGPFAKNIHLANRFKELGLVQKNFDMNMYFKEWFNKLFKLNKKLKKSFDKFMKEAKPNRDSSLICAQIRIGGKRPNVKYDKVFTKLENTVYYWNYIKDVFINKTLTSVANEDGKKSKAVNKPRDYKIFITTDTEAVETESRKVFDKKKIVAIQGVFTHIDKEYNYGNNCERFEKIILDFFVLEHCDMAIVSYGNFGRFGILRREKPYQNLALFNGVDSYITRF